jgi:hypothetical protein
MKAGENNQAATLQPGWLDETYHIMFRNRLIQKSGRLRL